MRHLFIALFAICIVSCNSDKKVSANTALQIETDTLKIKIDSTFLQFYSITSYDKSSKKLYAYNSLLHRLDYISIDSKTTGFIPLQKEGPNGVEDPIDIVVNDYFIYLIGYNYITKVNDKGEVVSKNKINDAAFNDVYIKHFLFPSQDSGFDYNLDDDVFYIRNTNMEYSSSKEPKKYYENSKLISRYSFEKDEVTTLNIPYPIEFQEKDFGFNTIPFILLEDNVIYYSFSPLPDIYKYDIAKKKILKHIVNTEELPVFKSDYKALSSTSKSYDLGSFVNNANFGPIVSNDKFILRVYMSGTPDDKIGLKDKSYKTMVLQIFDKNINVLKNHKIDVGVGFSGIFSDGDTFYFLIEANAEDEIRFLKITIK